MGWLCRRQIAESYLRGKLSYINFAYLKLVEKSKFFNIIKAFREHKLKAPLTRRGAGRHVKNFGLRYF